MLIRNRLAASACSLITVLSFPIFAAAILAPTPAHAAEPAPLVFIDPGHGGPLSNANANGLKEKNVNLSIGLALRDVLVARGYRVMMSRDVNKAPSKGDGPTWNYNERTEIWRYAADGRYDLRGRLPKDDLTVRVDAANAAGADLYISIHNNGSRRRSVRGTETYASKRDILGRRLSRLVQPRVARGAGFRNRGSLLSDFYVCRWSNMPAILVEGAYISNPSDARRLKSARVRQAIAAGIANGVDSWFAENPATPLYPRISAADPSSLSLALSRADFPGTAPAAVVVRSGEAALVPGAAVLASRLGGAMLLIEGSSPTTETAAELARLRPARIVFAGTDAAFDATATAGMLVASGVATSTVEMVVEADPENLSCALADLAGPSPIGQIALVSPTDTRALTGLAAIAPRSGLNVVLSSSATGPAAQYIARNKAGTYRLLSVGVSAIPACPDPTIPTQVMYSPNPDKLAQTLNEYCTPIRGPLNSMRPLVVNPLLPADVLVASAHSARTGQPVIPAIGSALSPHTREFITNRRNQIWGFDLLGVDGALAGTRFDWVLNKVSVR